MKLASDDFVHPAHMEIFCQAAEEFGCHILVRETKKTSLRWVGKSGYTGKRGDLKAKTAEQNFGPYLQSGLVCSPHLVPQAFPQKLAIAQHAWSKCAHLITVPNDKTGFEDSRQTTGCKTPYLVQTNPAHRHYGCVALVEMGLLVPRYVHGDYDLYALIPAGAKYDPHLAVTQTAIRTIGSTMKPGSLTRKEIEKLNVTNTVSALSFRVSSFINNGIERVCPDLLGALMVNHGEQVNLGGEEIDYQPVLAFAPKPIDGDRYRILLDRDAHEAYYLAA